MVTRGEAVGVLVLSEVVIGGVVVLLSFPTDRVVWIPQPTRRPYHFAGAATIQR
jgi:hypothetical protein